VGNEAGPAEQPELTTLLGGIVQDAETLIGQQFDLLRSELRQEVLRTRDAALSVGTGTVLVATGGVLASLMVVHALHRATRLPLWACYGTVGGLLGGLGVKLLAGGLREAAAIPLVPRQSVEALQENLAWLKDQAIPKAS